MNPEHQHALQEHIQAIAQILYDDTSPEQLTSLAGIERAVRQHMQQHVMPAVGVFLSPRRPAPLPATADGSKAFLGSFLLPVAKPNG